MAIASGLPAGDIPPNPSELLGSTLTSYLLQRLKEKFDILIIDSSPVMPVSDPLLLASLVDGVAIVVQAGMTDRKLVSDAAQQLTRANANLLGAVLNKVKPKTGGYYKYQYKYAQDTQG
jgi:polysaccharide biosynthesis transport protein